MILRARVPLCASDFGRAGGGADPALLRTAESDQRLEHVPIEARIAVLTGFQTGSGQTLSV